MKSLPFHFLSCLTVSLSLPIALSPGALRAEEAPAASATSLDRLPAVIEYVLREHPRVETARATTEISRQQARAVMGGLLPQVDMNASYGPNYRDRDSETGTESGDWLTQADIRGNIRQVLFDFGLTLNEKRAADKQVDAEALLQAGVEEEVALATVTAYLAVLVGREQLELAKQNVVIHRDTMEKTKQRQEAGRATSADMALVRGRVGLAEAAVDTRRVGLSRAEAQYEQLVGVRPPTLLQRPGSAARTALPKTDESGSIDGNYSVLAAEAAYEAAEYTWRAGKGLTRPRFEAVVSGGVGEDTGGFQGSDNDVSALVTGSWNLYSGGSLRAQQRERFAAARRARSLVEDARLVAKAQLDIAFAERRGALAGLQSLTEYASEMSEVVAAYEQQLDIGTRSILNVLDVKNEEFRAKSSLVDAQFAAFATEYQILEAEGRLVMTLVPAWAGSTAAGRP